MEIIAFNQIPDLFAVVGKLFVEKKEELCLSLIHIYYGRIRNSEDF